MAPFFGSMSPPFNNMDPANLGAVINRQAGYGDGPPQGVNTNYIIPDGGDNGFDAFLAQDPQAMAVGETGVAFRSPVDDDFTFGQAPPSIGTNVEDADDYENQSNASFGFPQASMSIGIRYQAAPGHEHSLDGSTTADRTPHLMNQDMEPVAGYVNLLNAPFNPSQTFQSMDPALEHQYGHRRQNIVPQQDHSFDQAGSPSTGSSVQGLMGLLDDAISDLQRFTKQQEDARDQFLVWQASWIEAVFGTRNAQAQATSQQQDIVRGCLGAIGNLSVNIYSMIPRHCLNQQQGETPSEQARSIPPSTIASSSSNSSAVNPQPQDMAVAHALNSHMQVLAPTHDDNAIGQSQLASNPSTSKSRKGKSSSRKGNKRDNKKGERANAKKDVSWHVPEKPARDATNWRTLRNLAQKDPEKFIRDYPNDLHNDMLWLIASQPGYDRLCDFIARVRHHHPNHPEFKVTAKPPPDATKEEKDKWADRFKNTFCKALSRAGEKFGPTGRYKWVVFKPRSGYWLDAKQWQENGCPKVKDPWRAWEKKIMIAEKKATMEAKEAENEDEVEVEVDDEEDGEAGEEDEEEAEEAIEPIANALPTSNPTSTHPSANGGESREDVSASGGSGYVNHDQIQSQGGFEQMQPIPQNYGPYPYPGQAQEQSSTYEYQDPTATPKFATGTGHIVSEEGYLGITGDRGVFRQFTTNDRDIDANQSHKRKRVTEQYSTRSSKFPRGPSPSAIAPPSFPPAYLPIDPEIVSEFSKDFNLGNDPW